MSAERPANHGQSSHGLRGDYRRMRPDYTVDQDYAAYTEASRTAGGGSTAARSSSSPGRACDEYERTLRSLDDTRPASRGSRR